MQIIMTMMMITMHDHGITSLNDHDDDDVDDDKDDDVDDDGDGNGGIVPLAWTELPTSVLG